jgi:hypothetical protein
MPRPSSVPPEESLNTVVFGVAPHDPPGRSPLALSLARCVPAVEFVLKESESTPTLTPVPSTSKAARADAAARCVSPSETTLPWQVLGALIIGASTSWIDCAPFTSASSGRSALAAATSSTR